MLFIRWLWKPDPRSVNFLFESKWHIVKDSNHRTYCGYVVPQHDPSMTEEIAGSLDQLDNVCGKCVSYIIR